MAKRKPAKKQTSKALAQTKRRRRRVLTFWRMIRYGLANFSRNAWLTIAATAVMTITLLIVFTSVVARDVLTNTVKTIQDSVEMTVYLKTDTEADDVSELASRVADLETVASTSIMTPEQARQKYIEDNRSDTVTLNSLNNSDPAFPWRIRVKMVDINEVDELQGFVDNDEALVRAIDPGTPPSFAGPNRDAIKQIGAWARFADRAGIAVGLVFVIISSLIIFNTIRMAIFNRQEEIQMMKLIGAEKSFIRGPFVVEAIIYGFLAALIAAGLGIFALNASREAFEEKGIAVASTTGWVMEYLPFVVVALIIVGAFIGVVSSLFATRRYLKI